MSSQIDDIYPLTPVQEALLFHCVGSSGDFGFTQVVASVRGTVDAANLKSAWDAVTNTHSALRTSIHWQDLESPVQVVRRSVPPDFRYEDLRGANGSHPVVQQRIEDDRSAGFILESAPLARLSVLRTGTYLYEFVISLHHMVADGWSAAIVVRDLLAAYDALAKNNQPRLAATGLKEYCRWLSRTDKKPAYDFWSMHLARAHEAARAPFEFRQSTDVKLRRYTVDDLDESLEKRLREFARAKNVTEGTVILAAWALLLIESNGSDEAVFGVVVSGRTADVPNVNNVVGPMSSTVPLCVRVSDDPLGKWLRTIQRDFQSASRYSYLPPGEILDRSGLPSSTRLFDTVVEIQNYPKETTAESDYEVTSTTGDIVTVFPLTLTWNAGDGAAQCFFDSSRVTEKQASEACKAFLGNLDALLTNKDVVHQDLATAQPSLRGAPVGHTTSILRDRDTRVLPSNDVERGLSELWQQTLGLQQVGVEDNYFDVGGTSLLAVRLARAIEKDFGVATTPISIALHPTIRRFASELLTGQLDSFADTVELKPGDSRLPALFTLQPPIMFADFARRYSGRRSILNVRGFEFNTDGGRLESYEEMAENAVRTISDVQPTGPYHILFKCAGALPYEVARQLREKGHEVGAVIVVDPGWIYPERTYGSRGRRGVLARLQHGSIDKGRILKYALGLARKQIRRAGAAVKRRRHFKELGERGRQAVRAGKAASQRYAPVKSDIELSFILTKEWRDREDLDSRIRRWKTVAEGGIRIVDFGQDHHSVLGGSPANSLADCVEGVLREYELELAATT